MDPRRQDRWNAGAEFSISVVLLVLLCILVVAASDGATESEVEEDLETGPAIAGTICLVCKGPVTADDISIVFRGRRFSVHTDVCLEAWNAARDTYFRALQPRGALFQEHGAATAPLAGGWLFLGMYVVLGLFFGGMCAYLAVSRGHPAVRWFVAGLVANVLAFAALLTRPSPKTTDLPTGVPAGLTKVPRTRAPVECPSCGAANHPAAGACTTCGAAVQPRVEPESARV